MTDTDITRPAPRDYGGNGNGDHSRPGTPLTPDQKTARILENAAVIIERLDSSLAGLEEHTVDMIDNLIVHLQNLKERVQIEKTAASERMQRLVNLSKSSLDHVQSIKRLTADLEQQIVNM